MPIRSLVCCFVRMALNKYISSLVRKTIPRLLPEALLGDSVSLQIDGNSRRLYIPSADLNVLIPERLFIVGFGKGAMRLAVGLNRILKDTPVKKAILSVPDDVILHQDLPPSFHVIKAAPINIPDANSYVAGAKICELLRDLQANDLLVVLVTGGGSALVSCPVPSVTSEDMSDFIRMIHLSGAPIEHLNAIRQQIDLLKAGGIAVLAYPARVLGFILSDVVGSDVSVIASGPTVLTQVGVDKVEAIELLHRYGILGKAPSNVKSFLELPRDHPSSRLSILRKLSRIPEEVVALENLNHVSNILIGSNLNAVRASIDILTESGIPAEIFEVDIRGDAGDLGKRYAELAYSICLSLIARETGKLIEFYQNTSILPDITNRALSLAKLIRLPDSDKNSLTVALVSGGETTVKVKGRGKGGRNQEAALVASIKLNELWEQISLSHRDKVFAKILFFSTDGQDGPTTATGAIADPQVVPLAKSSNLDPLTYLANNDSYSFWSQLDGGSQHICTGKTGTNVADVVVMIVGITLD